MTRASYSLAPSWLPRQRRRHVDRALRKLMRRETCSVCGTPFEPNTSTAAGFDARGNAAVAGECCVGKLTEIFGLGFNFPLSTSTGATDEARMPTSGGAVVWTARFRSTCLIVRGRMTIESGSSKIRRAHTACVCRSPASMTRRRSMPHPDMC